MNQISYNGIKRSKQNTEKPINKKGSEESLSGSKGVIICEICKAAYFNKRWYHGLEKIKSENQNLPVIFKKCPACVMLKSKQFEGKISIENVSEKNEKEITSFVSAYGRRAWERDPMDRVIAVVKNKKELVITTTENQLALKIARKLKQMLNKSTRDISFSPNPSDVTYIKIKLLDK